MGLVVELARTPARTRRRAPDRPCEITIFPGVRYERLIEQPEPAVAADLLAADRREIAGRADDPRR